MRFQGRVAGGLGQGAHFLALDWVRQALLDKFGLVAFPGTLNLRVPPAIFNDLFARRESLVAISGPEAHECPGYLTRAVLRAHGASCDSACIILPEQTTHRDMIEIIAPVSLRHTLGLSDGDVVEVDLELLR